MDLTQSPISQKSNFSSSLAPRENKLRKSDLNLSVGSLSIPNTAIESPAATSDDNNPFVTGDAEWEDENATANKESSIPATSDDPGHFDLPSLSDDVDKFLSILSSIGDTPAIPPEFPDIAIERFAALIENDIVKYESGFAEDHPSFLDSLDRASKLTAALTPFSSDPHYLQALNHTGAVIHHAMSFLEDDFHSLLLSSPSSPSRLRTIASSMISSGYETECSQVFLISRFNSMESSLSDQGFKKISIEDIQRMPWHSLESQMISWTKSFRHAITISFPQERNLCNEVFRSHRAIAAGIFHNLARGILIQLLNFAEAIAMSERSAEKLFKVLDMYEALRDAVPKLEDMFAPFSSSEGDGSNADLKAEVVSVQTRLGEAAVAMFCHLESSIKNETGKTPVLGGVVHPLTQYVMNYLMHSCEYKNRLEQVFRDHRTMDRSTWKSHDEEEGDARETGSGYGTNSNPFSKQLIKVIDLLYRSMEGKAKLYKDLALSNIFMMNNGRSSSLSYMLFFFYKKFAVFL